MAEEKDTNDPLDFGNYTITAATLLTLPTVNGKTVFDVKDALAREGTFEVGMTRSFAKMNSSSGAPNKAPAKRQRLVGPVPPVPGPLPPVPAPPPPPPPPPITSVGVMDIGIGNCTLLINNAQQPVVYFDIGYPLFFFTSSVPTTVRATLPGGLPNPAYLGPILQNTAANLSVTLSHWDWDHWRLGAIAGMQNIPWFYPAQPVGGIAAGFIGLLLAAGNANVYPGGTHHLVFPGYTIYEDTPPLAGPPAMIYNNSGLAMMVHTRLPVVDLLNLHDFAMPGDANFGNTNVPVGNITGIMAVHHGSNNHGAAGGLPAQPAPYVNQGRIAYSYGVTAGGAYPYGFPVPAAVAAYQAAGWAPLPAAVPPLAQSTAEGPNIRAIPPGVATRGNVRVGDQTALPVAYNNTAFFNYPNALT